MRSPAPDTLAPTPHIDCDHPAVVAFAHETAGGRAPRAAAVALHHRVRDMVPYSPWNVRLDRDGFRASDVLARDPAQGAHCIDKALLLAAAARALGIPARLHFANVRNHIGTARLEELLKTDLLVFHGYTELWLEGRWVAATPAFDAGLCARLGVAPLDFDGVHDAIFQAYDGDRRFMERVDDHGAHADLPFEAMIAAWRQHYPHIMAAGVWPRPPRRDGGPSPAQ